MHNRHLIVVGQWGRAIKYQKQIKLDITRVTTGRRQTSW